MSSEACSLACGTGAGCPLGVSSLDSHPAAAIAPPTINVNIQFVPIMLSPLLDPRHAKPNGLIREPAKPRICGRSAGADDAAIPLCLPRPQSEEHTSELQSPCN